MAEQGTDDIEAKMAGLDLACQKKLAGVMKTKFTRGEKDAASVLKLWSENIDDTALSERATTYMTRLRTDSPELRK